MKTARRQSIEPEGRFARALEKARKTGIKLEVDEITITPPTNGGKTWRLRTSYNNMPKERKCIDDIGKVNAAYLSLSAEIQRLRNGAAGLPEHSNDFLAELINSYIEQGGPESKWRGKTPKNRREDFAHLITLAKRENLKCADLNASVIRRYLATATYSGNRAKGMLSAIRTFTKWGIGAGYFTKDQFDSVSHVVWSPPKGSNYKVAPSRREQSKLHFGTADSLGGEVPTHEQIVMLATELQRYYQFGEGLIHVSANMGSRANETFIYTASKEVHAKGLGNYVDIKEEIVRIHWQFSYNSKNKAERVTKNDKFRSVVIPPVKNIESSFDIWAWLKGRSQEALKEQEAGTNPLSLIFPDANGNVMALGAFNEDRMRKALDSLGWKMPAYKDAKGKDRYMYRFTIHSLRDRFGTTAAEEWGYTELQLLEQGSWKDAETVRKFYLGTTDATFQSVRDLHKTRKSPAKSRKTN